MAGVGVLSAPWSIERSVVDRADVVLGELERGLGDSVAPPGIGRSRRGVPLVDLVGPSKTLFSLLAGLD